MPNYNYNNNYVNRRGQYQNNYHQNQRGQMNNHSGFRPDNRYYQNRNNNFRGNLHQGNYQNNKNFKNGRKLGVSDDKKQVLEEYDFEAANNQFIREFEALGVEDKDETKSGSENKEESSLDATKESNYYDKTKSFFDNISCESIERTKSDQQKFDWKNERKINAETFGVRVLYRRHDGTIRRPMHMNNDYSHQNRRYNGNQQRNAPKTNSS